MDIRSSSNMFEALTQLLEKFGGNFTLVFNDREEWVCCIAWGFGPDENVGGTAFGLSRVPAEAVEQALVEAESVTGSIT